MKEKVEWVKINGLSNYELSNLGQVKSLERYVCDVIKGAPRKRIVKEKIRKLCLNVHGYLGCRLRNDEGIVKTYSIHRLVAVTFVPNPDNLPEVNHKNGIKTDNRVENLEWCTHQGNMAHASKTGLFKNRARGSRNGWSKLTEIQVMVIKEAFLMGYSTRSIANYFKISFAHIQYIRYGKSWSHITIDLNQAA